MVAHLCLSCIQIKNESIVNIIRRKIVFLHLSLYICLFNTSRLAENALFCLLLFHAVMSLRFINVFTWKNILFYLLLHRILLYITVYFFIRLVMNVGTILKTASMSAHGNVFMTIGGKCSKYCVI